MRTKNKVFLFLLALTCVLRYKNEIGDKNEAVKEPEVAPVSTNVVHSITAHSDTSKTLLSVFEGGKDSTSLTYSDGFVNDLEMYDSFLSNANPIQKNMWNTDLPQLNLFSVENTGFIKPVSPFRSR